MTALFSYQPKGQLKKLATCIWVGKQPVLNVKGSHHAALFTELIVHFGDKFEMEGQHIVTEQEANARILLSGLKTRPFITTVSGRYAAVGIIFHSSCYGWLYNSLQSTIIKQRLVELCYSTFITTEQPNFIRAEGELMSLLMPIRTNALVRQFESFASWATDGCNKLGAFEQQLAVAPKTFIRHFKQHHCITPTEYIKLKQVNRALLLLRETGNGLAQVGLDCGFYDQAHFTKVFKAYMGCTPGDFRLFPERVNSVQYT